MSNVINIHSKLRLDIATQLLSGILSNEITMSKAREALNGNTWHSAVKLSLILADNLIEAERKSNE